MDRIGIAPTVEITGLAAPGDTSRTEVRIGSPVALGKGCRAVVTLRLAEDWLWDSWFAVDGDDLHVFYLCAPRTLGDPDRRHWHARVGHAVTRGPRSWEILPDALGPGQPGSFDSQATWTGSVLRHDGCWLMFYTGLRAGDDRVQRIGLAVSGDLVRWRRTATLIEADARWYEKSDDGGEEHWRDPWAFEGPDGAVHLLVTARAKDGPSDGRGVIGHAWSRDLTAWEVGPPLSEPGEFRQLEVPQLVDLGGRWAVLFSARRVDHGAARLARPETIAETGTHYLVGNSPLGPFAMVPGRFLVGGEGERYYAGRIVEWRGTRWFFAWIDRVGDRFVGELADPMPVRRTADGGLAVELPAIEAGGILRGGQT